MAARGVKKAFQQVNRINNVLLPQFENLKQRKLGRSAYNIYVDYKAVFVDFVKGMKNKPLKTSIWAAGLGGVYMVYRFNPNERDYFDSLMDNSVELLQIAKTIRNPTSDAYNQDILKFYNEGRLKRQSFLLFSVMLVDDFSQDADNYEKHCYYTKPRWIYLWKKVIDVGLLGHWIKLEQSMDDFDVNVEEIAQCPDDEVEGNLLTNKVKKVASKCLDFLEYWLYCAEESFKNFVGSH